MPRKPRLLDLFAGAGGAAVGYHRAGFEVVGVDHVAQPHYPFEFIQRDVLEWLDPDTIAQWGGYFDAIHGSPPCQAYIRGGLQANDHPRLIEPTRELLEATGLPYVIENVPGAPLRADAVLCGSMFGLDVRRHRWFESNVAIPPWRPPCDHSRPVVGVYGHPHGKAGAWPGQLPDTLENRQRAMGIDWMTAEEMGEAIPPAYTEWIGARLLEQMESVA